MKGFPNQVADLRKLATAMQCIVRLVDAGGQAKDDGILGQELVRAEVAGTGHRPQPVEDYIRRQLRNSPDRQSFRTTARGLRELFRILGFIDDSGAVVEVTHLGSRAAAFAGLPIDRVQISFWRQSIRNMSHDGGDGEISHPYQVLLRLIARRPRIEKPKCALALEARNDSAAELERVVALAGLSVEEIRRRLDVSDSNWANAVKVLPKFAEQLGDVIKTDNLYEISQAPGRADAGAAVEAPPRAQRQRQPRAPRTSRTVTPDTIGRAGTAENFDEVEVRVVADPVATARVRLDRLRRHNLLVRELAARLALAHADLFEDPFDVLAIIEAVGIMVEVKTLDGTVDDERARVREALSQLLYYSAFLVNPAVNEDVICKVACFEQRISDAHIRWLNDNDIAVIWRDGNRFAGDALASRFIGRLMEEFA
jgi:hypothetical protein